jgi:hypothetical protein
VDVQKWFERASAEVSETGAALARIQLTQSSAAWHVWEKPRDGWPEPEEWFAEFSAIMSELCEQWPARKLQVVLIGETRNGSVVSQCPFTAHGKDREAITARTGGESAQMKMMAECTEMLQRSWEKTLNVTNAQLEIQAKQVQKFGEQIIDLLTYVRQSEEYRATEAQRKLEMEAATKEDPLIEEVKKALPGLLDLAQMYATTKLKEGASKVASGSAVGKVVEAAVHAGVDAVNN